MNILKDINLHKNPDKNPEPAMDYWNQAKIMKKNVPNEKSWNICLIFMNSKKNFRV